MKKNYTFKKGVRHEIHWLIMELLAAYLVTWVVVQGGGMISSVIDQLLSGKRSGTLDSYFIGKLLLFVGIGFTFSLVRDLCASRFSVNIQKTFREEAGKKLVRLEFKYFDENGSGTILHKLTADIKAAGAFFSEVFPSICCILVEAITIIISIGKMDGMLVVFLAVGYPFILIISYFSSKRIGHLAKNRWEKIDALNDKAYDHIGGIVVGRSFNLMLIMEHRMREANQEILKFEFMRNRLSSLAWIMQQLVNWLPNIILATLALMRVLSGTITVGEMTYFVLILGRIIYPLSQLPSLFNESRELGVSIKRLEEIMEQPDEPCGGYTGTEKNNTKVHDVIQTPVIAFKEVTFGYDEEKTILNQVNFQVQAGEHVAFVGGSGEGKSTIFKLVCGFYKKQGGTYKLFGRDFEEWHIDSARQLFALVSQNVFLFPGTIAENVAYGKEGATLKEIQEACKLANIHKFIMSLPEEYNTLVGERGSRFSGGERQRLSIARAFLKDAPILLLDEPTSAIDVAAEDLIKEAIERISHGKTVITIAHRLSTIENVDTIMVLHKGEIVERGNSESLLALKGIYHDLYEVKKEVQVG